MNNALPRFETKGNPDAPSWYPEIANAAEMLGTPLMPWQEKAARLLGEYREDGRPRYKTVIVSVPRQQGKTTLSRAAIHARSQQEDRLQLYGTAQSRQYAAKHVVALGNALGSLAHSLKGVGAESVTWNNGSTYMPISPTEGGGHGDSIDFMLIDEGWALSSETMGGIRPAMIARPMSQMLIISTMGTVDSEVWNALVARGRESVEDPNSTMAYVEYSAEDDAAVNDKSLWGTWMPALGITVNEEDIEAAMADMEPNEIIRAFGNRTTTALNSVFPAAWVQDAWAPIQPPDNFVLAVDVNNDPAGATVATAHVTEEGVAVRSIEWRPGSPRWVPDFVKTIMAQRSVEVVVGDFGTQAPARAIYPEIEAICEDAYVTLVNRTYGDLGADTQNFYDALREKTVFLTKTEPLELAIGAAHKKNVGDVWLISRRQMKVDASPIISAILAFGTAKELEVRPVIRPFVM